MRKIALVIIFLGSSLLLMACDGGETAAAPLPDEIICNVAYRSSVQVGIEREETLIFTNIDDQQSASFTEATLNAAYDAGGPDNERNLRVWVTDSSGQTLQSTLYQFAVNSGPQNQFVGGHGFTGLNYSYPPGSTAELQFWCTVEIGN